jgi:hypothetical protein
MNSFLSWSCFSLWCRKVEEAVSNEVELQIHGVEKPSVWRLYGVQFILLPYFIGKASSCLLNLCVLSWATCRGPPLQLQPFGLACSCLESLTWSILTELYVTFLVAGAYLGDLLVLEIPGKEITICMGRCLLLDSDFTQDTCQYMEKYW